ncbi:MAG: hypothetical protein GXP52_04900 [Deltaproteobacteria bacterium]|nr:hypothetical protein [Deltaproteobacteria bacterium]
MDLSYGSTGLLLTLIVLTFVATLPFGYWRVRCRKFSVNWFLAIHLIIPFIIAMRILGGFSYLYIPLFIISALLGQFAGGVIRAPK